MELSCSIIPQVRNSNGDIVDSNLFRDIMKLSSKREVIVDLYQRLTSSFFLTENSDKIEFDDNNEPILNSVIKVIDINPVLGESLENILLKKIGESGTEYENTVENITKLSEKASSFNDNSEYRNEFVALPVIRSDGKLIMSITKSSEDKKAEAERMKANYLLNNRIRDILSLNGLKVSALDALEERLGTTGMVDFSVARNAGKGIIDIIRLSRGFRGEQALPEEYAHFIIEAMADDTLINRSLNSLYSNDDLVKSILGNEYDTYIDSYDPQQMAKEALARILTLHLLNNMSTDGIALRPLIDRTINNIKKKFSSIDDTEITDTINNIWNSMESISKKVISPDTKIDLNNIKIDNTLKHIDRKKKALSDIIQKEIKRYEIYVQRTKDDGTKEQKEKKDKFKSKQLELINDLRKHLTEGTFNEGILSYLESVGNIMQQLKDRLEINAASVAEIETKSGVLLNISDYIDSFVPTINELIEYSFEPDSDLSDTVKSSIKEISADLKGLASAVSNENRKLYAKFLSGYLTENIKDSEGNMITQQDLEKMLKESEKDVTTMGLWLSAAQNVDDVILKLADKAIKSFNKRARRRVKEYLDRMNIADAKLKKAGINNYDFIYAKYSDGSYSPYYKTDVDYARFDEEKRAFLDSMNEKYGKHPTGEMAKLKTSEIGDWFRSHCYSDSGLPIKEKYPYKPTFDTKAEEEYYNTFMDMRAELIKMLPSDTYKKDPARVIQIRKDFLDRLKTTSPLKWKGLITQQLADTFSKRENDPQSNVYKGIEDFRGREVYSLPIFFVSKLSDGQQDVSRDASSSLMAFAHMAIEYDELSKINDIMEVGRNVAEERTFQKMKAGKPVVEKFKTLGETVESTLKQQGTSNFAKMYNELLESQLYQRYSKEGDDFWDGKVNTKKTADFLNRASSLNQLAVNFLAGVAAVGTDEVAVLSEAWAAQFFSRKDLFNADKVYFKNILELIAESGDNNKNNKMALFAREFDLLHEFENDIRNKKFGKSRLARVLGENALYIFMQAGSHFGEMRVALAVAMNTKVLKDGKEISLYDAYQVVPNDPDNKDLGSRLVLDEGITKLDGTPIDEEFLNQYEDRAIRLNQRLFGIYNNADKNYLQKTAIGSMAMLYRKHIIPAIQRRYGKKTSNAMLDAETEGYYITGYKIARKIVAGLKETRSISALFWPGLDSFEKQQIKRVATDIISLAGLWTLIFLSRGLDWDDKDNPYLLRMLAYQSNRIQTEVQAFTPFGVTGEALQILNSPMATMNVIDSAIDLLDLIYPPNWFDEIESGRFKGHSKAYKSFMRSPLVPMNNTIYRSLHPEETLQYFNLK